MLISTRDPAIPLGFADTMRGHGRSGMAGWVVVAITAFGLLLELFRLPCPRSRSSSGLTTMVSFQ